MKTLFKKTFLSLLCVFGLQSCIWNAVTYKEPTSWSAEAHQITTKHYLGKPSFWRVVVRGLTKEEFSQCRVSFATNYSGCSVFWAGTESDLRKLHSSSYDPLNGIGWLNRFTGEDRVRVGRSCLVNADYNGQQKECSFLVFISPATVGSQDFSVVITYKKRRERQNLLVSLDVEKGLSVSD